MCAISVEKLVKGYIINNPNASPEDLKVMIKQRLDSYKGKVRPEDYERAYCFIDSRRSSAAIGATNNPTVVTRKAQQAIQKVNQNAVTVPLKDIPNPTVVSETRLLMPPKAQEVQVPTRVSTPRVNNKAARRASLMEGMIDTEQVGRASLSEGLELGGPVEKAALTQEMQEIKAPEQYVSKKKLKKAKKAKNAADNAAKQKNKAVQNNRAARNAQYCTKNEYISTESGGKNALEQAKAFEQANKYKAYAPESAQSGLTSEQWKQMFQENHPEATVERGGKITRKIRNTLSQKTEFKPYSPEASHSGLSTSEWQKELEAVWGKGNVEVAGKAAPKTPPGVSSAAEKAAEATNRAARRIGKKGWIGIGIAALALITGLVVHHNHKKQSQSLNVNA